MFKDEVYENEFGKCAFLAGAIEVITSNLDVAIQNAGVRYEALAADVFCTQADEVEIKQLVCDRLEKLIREDFGDARMDEWLEMVKQLRLEPVAYGKSMRDALMDLYGVSQWEIDRLKLEVAVESYCRDVQYYLGEPKTVFTVTEETMRNAEIIGRVYLGMLFNIVFVRFEQHMLMFLRGSVE